MEMIYLFCKFAGKLSTSQRMPTMVKRVSKERSIHAKKQKQYQAQMQSYSDSIPVPESSDDQTNVFQNNQDKRRHHEIKEKMKKAYPEQLPKPSLFSKKYDADDHEDLIHAFQQIMQCQESQDLIQLNETLQNQVQEILQLQQTHHKIAKPINDSINKEVTKIVKEQNGNDKGKKQVQQIIDQQNKVFDQLASLIKQQLYDQQMQVDYDTRLNQLQNKLKRAQEDLNQQYDTNEMTLEQIFNLQNESLILQQIFTNIQIAPGNSIADLQKFQQQLNKQIQGQEITQNHFVFVNTIDKINYQGLLRISSDKDVQLNEQQCTLETLQIPQNIIQERQVLDMFEGSTQTTLNYLWMVYKHLCAQFIRYKISQMEQQGKNQ